MADTSLIDSLKPKGTGVISAVLSGLFFAGTMLVNLGSSRAHNADVQAQHEKRIAVLEESFKNDMATRREVQEFKADTNVRLIRIENKLDEEIRFHRR
ncbi:MAG: hypothetical protein LAP21_21375 [Acidobacteriia bacterium]|nr:hypothetical protein [Terriglobia bacterium]